jgi:hypothetical protein
MVWEKTLTPMDPCSYTFPYRKRVLIIRHIECSLVVGLLAEPNRNDDPGAFVNSRLTIVPLGEGRGSAIPHDGRDRIGEVALSCSIGWSLPHLPNYQGVLRRTPGRLEMLHMLMVFHGTTTTTRNSPNNLISELQDDLLFSRSHYYKCVDNTHCFILPGLATSEINLFNFAKEDFGSFLIKAPLTTLPTLKNLGAFGVSSLFDAFCKGKVNIRRGTDITTHVANVLVARYEMQTLTSILAARVRYYMTTHNEKKLTITLAGWSRGAITCIDLANEIHEKIRDASITFNVFSIDPCFGPTVIRSKKNDSTSGFKIKNMIEIIMIDEGHFHFPSQYFKNKKGDPENFRRVFLPGEHGSSMKNEANNKYGNYYQYLRDELYSFVEKHTSIKRVAQRSYDYSALNKKYKARLKEDRDSIMDKGYERFKKNFRTRKSIMKLYADFLTYNPGIDLPRSSIVEITSI